MFIKRSDIENSISWISREKSKEIFNEYVKKLEKQGKKQLLSHLLPTEWFVKNFSKDYGLDGEEIKKLIKEYKEMKNK